MKVIAYDKETGQEAFYYSKVAKAEVKELVKQLEAEGYRVETEVTP